MNRLGVSWRWLSSGAVGLGSRPPWCVSAALIMFDAAFRVFKRAITSRRETLFTVVIREEVQARRLPTRSSIAAAMCSAPDGRLSPSGMARSGWRRGGAAGGGVFRAG